MRFITNLRKGLAYCVPIWETADIHMSIHPKILPIFLLVAMSSAVWARIGETQQQCEERYGEPESTGFYIFKNRRINITFEEDKAVRVEYDVDSWEEAAELLGKNHSGEWRAVPGPEKKDIITSKLHFYESSDGLLKATYIPNPFRLGLVIETAAFAKAEEEAKAAKEKKFKAEEEAKSKDRLEGL